jgi:hypothetical protein
LTCLNSTIRAETNLTCNLLIRTTASSSISVALTSNSSSTGNATNLQTWTNLTIIANTATTLTPMPIMFTANDTYLLTAVVTETSTSLVITRQTVTIVVTPAYRAYLSLNPSTTNSTSVLVGRTVQVNLLAVTLGALVPFSVNYGDSSDTFNFSLQDSSQIISKAYALAGIYTLAVTGQNPLSMVFNVTAPPECPTPSLSILNAATSFSNPSQVDRSSTLNLTALVAFNCSFNFTLTKQWSLIEVSPSNGTLIGAVTNLTANYDQSELVLSENSLLYGLFKFTCHVNIVYSLNNQMTYLYRQHETSTFVKIVPFVELK